MVLIMTGKEDQEPTEGERTAKNIELGTELFSPDCKINEPDGNGKLTDEICPICQASLLMNPEGTLWCSNPECEFGLWERFRITLDCDPPPADEERETVEESILTEEMKTHITQTEATNTLTIPEVSTIVPESPTVKASKMKEELNEVVDTIDEARREELDASKDSYSEVEKEYPNCKDHCARAEVICSECRRVRKEDIYEDHFVLKDGEG